jgi:hypothetical protein
MTVRIEIVGEDAKAVRAEMDRLLGREVMSFAISAVPKEEPEQEPTESEQVTATTPSPSGENQNAAIVEQPKRRGRRTKAEMEAARAAEQAKSEPQISTAPEARVGPEDDPQDDADEQAESEATRPPELTHDDIRNAFGQYVNRYGMAAAQEDGQKLFAQVFDSVKVEKISEIPNDQQSLTNALWGVKEMIEKNPFERKAVS